jgi:Flp pilus assembly protein TadG
VSPVPDRRRSGERLPDRDGDRGAAVVEFVLVGVLLIVLFLAVLQIGLALHVRNTLVACAAEGARYAANADRVPQDGAEYASALIRRSLSERFAREVSAGYDEASGTVEVEVRASIPVIGFLGPPRSLVVRGHALEEPR